MTLDEWRELPPPKSEWRRTARRVMHEVVDANPDALASALLALVDAAFPFDDRKTYPYKAWLTERNLLRGVLEAAQRQR